MEAIEQVPRTALDVFRMLPEGTLCEVIDNILYMSPAPKYTHQRLVLLFSRKIGNYLESTGTAELIISPFDVYFEDHLSAVQPDLLVVTNENRHILKEDGCIHGAPDIIIEVLSSDKNRDLIKKKNLYEKVGVTEYFVVNPDSREITSWLMKGNVYELQHKNIGLFKSAVLSMEFEF